MIYLFDDKASRRRDFGWSDDKIASYKDSLVLVENIESLRENKNAIFNAGNVILLHESYRDHFDSQYKDDLSDFYNEIEANKESLYIAKFSGSNYKREQTGNYCSLNPAVLYQNLSFFISQVESGSINLRTLLFGKNFDLEEKLRKRAEDIAVANVYNEGVTPFVKQTTDKKVLFFINNADKKTVIDPPFVDIESYRLSNLKNGGDREYYDMVKSTLSENTYDVIYLPLCYGQFFSDFLGLRLALFIRLSDTINRTTPIYIYGEAEVSDLMENECSDILKMKGVDFINSSNKSIVDSINKTDRITESDFLVGIKKIHLEVPTDIGDNHSISNKWGIYRWSCALGLVDGDISKTIEKVENNLYFIYLNALYPASKSSKIEEKDLKAIIDHNQKKLNVLLVDDEADSGWNALMCKLVYGINKIDYDCINGGFKSMSQDEIIQNVLEKIKDDGHNLILLDFRLHKDDSAKNIQDITGYKLLKKIKSYNRAIQVIVISATNKIWNLLELQKEDVDGFIIKESPLNSKDPEFTKNTITQLVQKLSECSNNTYKIDLYNDIRKLSRDIDKLYDEDIFPEKYYKGVCELLLMSEDAMFSRNTKYPKQSIFLHLFRILDLTCNELYTENENKSISLEDRTKRILHVIGMPSFNLHDIIGKRNSFIHPKSKNIGKVMVDITHDDIRSIFKFGNAILLNFKDIREAFNII